MADALIGGEVKLDVGSQSFTAVVNEAGEYQLTLDIANTDIDQPVTAIATGAASNQWVQLAALYPSIRTLHELAGADQTLEASEYIGVNISPMTTAEYTLIKGKKLPAATDAERKNALLQITAEDQLRRAAFVQKMLTDADVNFPARYETTLDMLLDYEYTRAQINILLATNQLLGSGVMELQQDSRQVRVADGALTGNFLVNGEGFSYLLDLNENGTGHLLTSNSPGGQIWAVDTQYHEATFTWVKDGAQITITLDEAIDFGRSYGAGQSEELCALAEPSDSPQDCAVSMFGMTISLIADTEVGQFADIALDVTFVNRADETVLDLSSQLFKATLLDRTQLYKLSKAEVEGFEWFTDNFSYAFNANGTAIQTNQMTKAESVVHWQLEDGVLTMDGATQMLLPVHTSGPGFTAMQLLVEDDAWYSINEAFLPMMLIKRESVNMAESDWVGRWQRIDNGSFYSAIDFYSDHVYRDGYETQSLGSWGAVSSSHANGLSNGTWRMEYELLAIHDGQHYMQYCYGADSENFTPTNCILEAYVIDKTFTGTTFWESWSYPVFEEGNPLTQWTFNGYAQLYIGFGSPLAYKKVAANMLYDETNGKVLEMLSSTQNTIELCEYDAFSSCESGTTHHLTRGVEVKVTVAGEGSVLGTSNGSRAFMRTRSYATSFSVIPSEGYQVTADNISGCGGTLFNTTYEIPGLDSDCEVTVTFTPLPL